MTTLQEAETVVRAYLCSYESGKYEDFQELSTGKMKEVPRSTFFRVQEKLGTALTQGYTLEYLTDLRQYNQRVFTWKLSFSNGRGDVLLPLTLAPGGVRPMAFYSTASRTDQD